MKDPKLSKDFVEEIEKLCRVFNEANAEIPRQERRNAIMAALVFSTIAYGKDKMKFNYDEIGARFAVSIALHEALG